MIKYTPQVGIFGIMSAEVTSDAKFPHEWCVFYHTHSLWVRVLLIHNRVTILSAVVIFCSNKHSI